MSAQGRTAPLNHESQKTPLKEQQGKWLANPHPMNSSTVVQGAAFLLSAWVHVSHPEGGSEQLSSDPPSLHPWPQDVCQKSWQKDNDHGTVPLN